MPNFLTTQFTAKPRNPAFSVGKKYRTVSASANLLTASLVNGDTLQLAGPLSLNSRVARIFSPNATPALTSAVTNLGFYTKDAAGNLIPITSGGATVLWNAQTALQSALTTRDILYGVNTSLSTTANIAELLGIGVDNEPANGVFLAFTFTTKPSVNGVLDLDIVIEEATSN